MLQQLTGYDFECYHWTMIKNRKVYKPPISLLIMSIHIHQGICEATKATLVDAYLPPRAELIERANAVSQEIRALPREAQGKFMQQPYSWRGQSDDDLFAHIAYTAKGLYHRSLPAGSMDYTYNEMWLLNPGEWSKGYHLKDNKKGNFRRRLLVTLHRGFEFGEQSREKVIENSGLQVIADSHYKNINAFHRDADALLYDVSLPYIAPNVVAEEKLAKAGYSSLSMGM